MKNKICFLELSLFVGLCFFFAVSCDKENENEQAKIPVLSTNKVSEITETTVVSGGNISDDNGASVTKRGVCWGTKQNPTIQNNKTEDGSGTGSFTSNISGLMPNTTYYLRSYATNSVGTAYGSTVSFTTLEEKIDTNFTDPRDGNVYKIVKIGDQIWMAENLRYLPNVVSPKTASETTPYYYVYGYYDTIVSAAKVTSNYITYGVLYNWPAACSSCPPGWHLPTAAEWNELIEYLGGKTVAGSKLKEASTTYWKSPNTGATNETGFTALPGGYRFNSILFGGIGEYGFWWSSAEFSSSFAYYCKLHYASSEILYKDCNKSSGNSVRCVKD